MYSDNNEVIFIIDNILKRKCYDYSKKKYIPFGWLRGLFLFLETFRGRVNLVLEPKIVRNVNTIFKKIKGNPQIKYDVSLVNISHPPQECSHLYFIISDNYNYPPFISSVKMLIYHCANLSSFVFLTPNYDTANFIINEESGRRLADKFPIRKIYINDMFNEKFNNEYFLYKLKSKCPLLLYFKEEKINKFKRKIYQIFGINFLLLIDSNELIRLFETELKRNKISC